MKAERLLESLYATLITRLLRATTDFQRGNTTLILNDIETLLDRGFNEIAEFISNDAVEFALDESLFSEGVIQRNSRVILSTPDISQIEQAVLMNGMDTPIGAGTLTLGEAIAAFKARKTIDINLIINNGILTGETTAQITRNITTVLGSQHKAQINTLVRTSINHASSMARKTISEQNASILKGDEWVATLDSNTTLICGGRDGRIFPVGKGPFPPAHWNACIKNTMITTDQGDIPIQDVKVGDYALTHTGEFKRVYAVMAKPHKGKIVELINFFGSVKVTHDHPVLTSIGYKPASEVARDAPYIFNYGKQFKWSKDRVFGSLVENRILLDSHNIKTHVSESLVSYSISSVSTGVSSAIKLEQNTVCGISIKTKVSNVFTSIILMLITNVVQIKALYKKLFVKCWILFKGFS